MPRTIRGRAGAAAVDSRLGAATPMSYSPSSTGPAGPWPASHGGAGAYSPQVSTLIVLTVAEIVALAALRHTFRRYHGG